MEIEMNELRKLIAKEVRQAMASPYLTVGQAAKYLKVSPKTIAAWRRAGKLRPLLVGKRWRYTKADLDKVLVDPWIR